MDKYLLQILLDVNTIIIPGLGALTVTNPKTREMMFMSYLKYDDGKLASYISEKEGMSENDAKNLIAKYVRDIQAKLDQGQTYDMFEFGRFFKNKDGDVDFEAWGTFSSGDEAAEVSPNESVLIADEVLEVIPEMENVVEEEETSDAPAEEIEEVAPVIPMIDEASETSSEQVTVIIPEFQETDDEETAEESDVIEDLTVMPEPPSASLDEILERSEEKNTETENIAQVNTDPIALPTQNEEKVQVENIYIPPAEKKPEPAVVAEKEIPLKEQPAAEKVQSDVDETSRKKRGAGFWILITLLVLILVGGVLTVVFYDRVKTYMPFLENKRVEAASETVNQDSIDQLNQTAEELEEAENERITGAPQDGTEVSETITEPVAEEVPLPAPVMETPKPVKSESSRDGSKPYHVIGGAFSEKSNADRYAEKLRSGGNNSVIVGRFDNLYLVSIDSYSSKAEAQSALNGFESITGRAWVFKWP